MAKKYVLGPAGARKLRALFNGRGESGSVRGSDVPLTLADDYVAPYTVQWAQSANNGAGSWIIWLPTSDLVIVPEDSLDPSAALTAADGDYPAGWYILTDAMLDRDGGTLYLNVALDTPQTATFSASAVAASDDEFDIPVCYAAVDVSTGVRTVKQFLKSVVVVGGGGGIGGEYGCDEASVSRIAVDASGDGLPQNGNDFFLKGFGKWSKGGRDVGAYHPATITDLEVDDEASNFAVVCRDGNTPTTGGNSLAYRKLRIVNPAGSSPFQYTKSTTTDSSSGQTVTTHKLVNCCFYWNGVLQSLSDYDVSGLLSGGTVYLRGTQTAPSTSSPDPTWTWSLGTSQESAPSGGKVLNFKIYDFAQSKVAVDYRTTFMAMVDHTPKSKIVIGDPTGNRIELDASGVPAGGTPKIVIHYSIWTGDRTITIDPAQIPLDCFLNFSLGHTITYKNADGSIGKVHALMCNDLDLSHLTPGGGGGGGGGGDSLPDIDAVTDVTFAINAQTHKLVATLTKKNISSGAVTTVNRDVCAVADLDVVVAEDYSMSTHQFTNTRKAVTVIGSAADAQGQTVFTTTPHSNE